MIASEASNFLAKGGSRVQTKPTCPNFFECPNVSTYISFISWHKASWREIWGEMYVGFRIMQKHWSFPMVLVVGELNCGWI